MADLGGWGAIAPIPENFFSQHTVGIFGLSRRTCNFCALKRASFAQKLSYITYKATLNKIKHFLKKKIFNEKYLRGTLTLIFSRKIFLFENVLCHTSSDAVSRADSEYRLIL